MTREQVNLVSGSILDSCFVVHREMGPGLLESVYELCLLNELRSRGLSVASQVSIPLLYRGTELSKDFRIDILVEDEVIVEVKSVEVVLPVHKAQIISYLKLANKRLGLLVNFNVPLIENGFLRFANGL